MSETERLQLQHVLDTLRIMRGGRELGDVLMSAEIVRRLEETLERALGMRANTKPEDR